jgi:type I restriction enzyme R subunit
VPYQIYKAKTVKTAAEGGFEVKKDELDWSAMDAVHREELEQLFGDRNTITIDPSALERRFTIPERNRAIVREFREVLERATSTARACCANRCSARPSSSPSPSATPRRWRSCSTQFADKKPSPEVRYADYVVSGQTGAGRHQSTA